MGLYTGVVFLDSKKAFDTVDHSILLKKLRKYGFGVTTINLFATYLSNRIQRCSVNRALSDACNLTCGVPQGSIVGALFILCINDLHNMLEFANVSGPAAHPTNGATYII